MSTDYTPRAESLPAMVVGYCTNHPKAKLSLDGIVELFKPTDRNSIHSQLARAVEAELLYRIQDQYGEYHYKLGPELLKPAPDLQQPPATVTAAAEFDLLAVAIEDGIPLPSTRTIAPEFAEFLPRLQPGQSAQLPFQYRNTLAKAIGEAHKAGPAMYAIRKDKAAQTLRVWRVK
jgi:hypothetical protein